MNRPKTGQLSLFDIKCDTRTPAEEWSEDAAKHALDELFNATYAYRSSKEFSDLMRFVSRFRFYSPYNAMLIRLQRPRARFVATPTRSQPWTEGMFTCKVLTGHAAGVGPH